MAFSLASDKPIKYATAEGKYYTLDYGDGKGRPTLGETNLDEIRGRMGDQGAGFDFNSALQGLKTSGALREAPSLAELKAAAAEQGYGVPGSFGQAEGNIPKSTEFSNYLGQTGQNFQNNQFVKNGVASQYMEGVGGQNVSPFESGFNQESAKGTKTPGTAGEARNLTNTYADTGNQGNQQADVVTQANQAHQKYLNDFTQSQTSINQGQTLTQQYTQLSQQLGLPAINTQLLNMKAIMDGSEQDLRNEITKAGGFATDSQVLALTTARNKTMIQNYNNLLQTRDDMQKNLTTMIGLSEKDRAYASAQIDKQLNFDLQQQTYADKMLNNAQDSLNNSAKVMGWNGILQSALASGDPQAIQRINSTMGNGFDVTQAAQKETKDKALSEQKAKLETQKLQAEIYKIYQDTGGKNGVAPVNTPQGQKQLATAQSQVQQISDLTQDSYLTSAVGPNAFARLSFSNMFTGGKSNFIAGVEQLRSQLNLSSLIDAKSKGATFGALSDQEGQMLANAATKIGTWAIKDKNGKVTGYNVDEKDFKKELDKINNFAKLDYVLRGGDPNQVGVKVMPNGKRVVQNSDGTFTELD